MSALNNQTNRNGSRYFFATSDNGQQTLGLQYGTTGGAVNLSTMAVTISGTGGNGVIVNQAPQYIATEFVLGDEAVCGGSSSTYWTPSTLTSNFTGFNLTTDRLNATGIACIESYGGNGTTGGFEFLSRGVNSALLSTTSFGINNYVSSLGRPGATAVLGASGTFVTGTVQASLTTSVDLAPSGFAGRECFTIDDLSGATPVARWSLGTATVPAGGNSGSDLTLRSYADDGLSLATPLTIKRSDGSMAIGNISSIATQISTATFAQVYPASKTNVEFGADSNVAVIAGSSNQAFPFMPLLSTPLTGLNPNGQTFVSINWANSLSSGSNHVNFKVGFSTGTAYTNILQTAYVPGVGGSWTPSDQPGPATPFGHTLITACIDPDGVNPDGSGVLYVLGQLADPNAAADQLFIAKGTTAEPTRNSLVWRPI